ARPRRLGGPHPHPRDRLPRRPPHEADPRAEGLREEDARRPPLRLPGGPSAPAGHRRHGAGVHRPRVRRRVAADAAPPGQAHQAQREGTQGAAARDRGGGGMTPANVVAYCVQITIVVALCAGLPRILGLRSPGVQYAFWRLVLAVCLALPLLQPWRPQDMVFVPSPVEIPSAGGTRRALIGSAPDDRAPRRDWTDIARTILLVGIGGRLFWVPLGAVRLRSLRRRASDSPAPGFDELQQALGTTAQILWSSDV